MKTLLLVALGGALGVSCRYGVGVVAAHLGGTQFPWGTFLVNIAGSFALGVAVTLMTFTWSPSPELRAFVMVGVLGGFTTFSAFSLDAVTLYERGQVGAAAGYVAVSVVFSIGALFAGMTLMKGALQ